jgi:hypothetical protein
VVFLGALPGFVAGRDDLNARKANAADFSWATLAEGELSVTPTPPAQPPTAAPGPLVVPAAWLAAVQKALPADAVTLAQPDTALRVMHRSLKDGTVFLLFNESAQPIENRLTLRGGGGTVEVWDPQTGASAPAAGAASAAHGSVTLPLQLAPYATEVLIEH